MNDSIGKTCEPSTLELQGQDDFAWENAFWNVDCNFTIDTNGQSLPNQIGVDIMRYDINSEGKLICSHQDLLNNALLYDKVEYTPYNFGDEIK